ncbi:hypothetical protein OIO90_002854 [Microbotryomycetes sp. JL221]|nr:hypothetical protein OIO90_002854 [Microbotryomycetes sp. JL221]
MTIKAVIFDIGGVCVGSPIEGVNEAERLYNLPVNYLNASITARGKQGAFQRLERGELDLETFYRRFGQEMSDTTIGNQAYKVYCERRGKPLPTNLPHKLDINGKEMWAIMMKPATEPDQNIIEAINALRGRFKIAALTNNFNVPGVPKSATPTTSTKSSQIENPLKPKQIVSFEQLRESLHESRKDPNNAGAPNEMLKSMFDLFVESSVEGLRKPDPKFYQLALDRLGVKPNETVFLDDIGHNLVAAKKLGINTIRVELQKSAQAVDQLEKIVGIPLKRGLAKL